jgi:hypothetical protein
VSPMPKSLAVQVTEPVRKAVDFALLNIGVCEDPPGSNRGPEIDEWCKEFGSPLGSYWCAISVGKARKVGGLWVPSRDVGSCDEWFWQAEEAGKLASKPVIGAAVLYTNHKRITTGRYAGRLDIVHIGLVLRVTPVEQSVEGNTTLGKYDRNGYTQTHKEVDKKRVAGYVLP